MKCEILTEACYIVAALVLQEVIDFIKSKRRNQYLIFGNRQLSVILLSKEANLLLSSTVFATAQKETVISSGSSVLDTATHFHDES